MFLVFIKRDWFAYFTGSYHCGDMTDECRHNVFCRILALLDRNTPLARSLVQFR